MNTLQAVTLMTVSSLWIVGCPVQMPGVDVVLGDTPNGESTRDHGRSARGLGRGRR